MPHQSYLYREIHEQPVVLESALSGKTIIGSRYPPKEMCGLC